MLVNLWSSYINEETTPYYASLGYRLVLPIAFVGGLCWIVIKGGGDAPTNKGLSLMQRYTRIFELQKQSGVQTSTQDQQEVPINKIKLSGSIILN